MRKTTFTMAIIGSMALTMFTACQSSSKKVENAKENVLEAKENVVEAKQELNQALKDSIKDFRKKSEDQLIANEKSLALYKEKIAREKKENRANYEKEWAQLVQKNKDMKVRLENYNEETEGNWEVFKSEFNRDMDELGKAFKDLTVKNVK